jgi:predicted metal-dependent hydrolase
MSGDILEHDDPQRLAAPETELEWEVRVSWRIRQARLQIKPYGGLEVVIPPRFPRREIPRLVAQHADWVRRHLSRQAQRRDAIGLPELVRFAFDDTRVAVIYRHAGDALNYDLFAPPADETWIIEGDDYARRMRALRQRIRERAWAQFPPLLEAISTRCGLEFRRLGIRSQKTRWGSCSRNGTISLNDQLLFVPRETVEYLMIHELCHTRHLNHSKRFWALVARHCPDYRQHERMLGQPQGLIPEWFVADLYR